MRFLEVVFEVKAGEKPSMHRKIVQANTWDFAAALATAWAQDVFEVYIADVKILSIKQVEVFDPLSLLREIHHRAATGTEWARAILIDHIDNTIEHYGESTHGYSS